ncbi:unnamed protein product [Caenorhabditis auriculariae]|uniref:Uncharacterized protein n=1 Tax=Caenorhabditis auriculariae TaxID=2777116 RepID=A0A8S1HUG2_9PELO|nr:unnamed protein product [Caenorhabditis auriculariae]
MLSRTQFLTNTASRVYLQNAQRMAHGSEKGVLGAAIDKTKEMASDAKERMKDAYNSVAGQQDFQNKSYADATSDKSKDLREQASSTWENLKDKAADLKESVKEIAQDGKEKVQSGYRQMKEDAAEQWDAIKGTPEETRQARDFRERAGEQLKKSGRDIQKRQ